MLIEVTQEHIGQGVAGIPFMCPIAYALRQRLNTRDVLVGSCGAYIGGVCHSIPQSVRDFIKSFDHNKKVNPFTFELDLKPEATSDQA